MSQLNALSVPLKDRNEVFRAFYGIFDYYGSRKRSALLALLNGSNVYFSALIQAGLIWKQLFY